MPKVEEPTLDMDGLPNRISGLQTLSRKVAFCRALRRLQRLIPRGMAVGFSCSRCGAYFVTNEEGVYMCPWCQRTLSGEDRSMAYESEDALDA